MPQCAGPLGMETIYLLCSWTLINTVIGRSQENSVMFYKGDFTACF